MKTVKQLTYPIVVIESIWPYLPAEAPKIVGPDKESTNILKPSGSYNDYSGYYRVIPLNILGINTSSSLNGHTFSITFDASYVYVDFDRKYFPQDLAAYIQEQAIDVDAYNLHVLVGVLKSLTGRDIISSDIESYIVPFDTIASIVSELDTVSIYQISEEDIFDFESILMIGGGSFSRITPSQADNEVNLLRKVGLPERKPPLETISDQVRELRAFLTALGLLTYYDLAGHTSYPYEFNRDNYTEHARRVQLEGVNKYFSGSIDQVGLNSYFPDLLAEKILTQTITKNQLINEINSYYSTNSIQSSVLPYSYYKTIYLSLQDVFGTTAGIEKISITAAVDAILAKYNPALFSKIREDEFGTQNIALAIEFVNSLGIKRKITVEDYVAGLNRFSHILADKYGSLESKNSNILVDEFNDIQVEVPPSSETPYSVLKGHITSISSSSSIDSGYTKTITLQGEGLEAPLKRHNVFFDVASANRLLLQLPTQYSVINSTPIEAVSHILETFMPEYVQLTELSQGDIHEANQTLRDFSVYVENYGKKVSKGALLLPDLLQTSVDSYVFAPISYTSNSYLEIIKSAFDEIAIYERKAQILAQAPEGPVSQVLDEFLGKNSIYNWHVDEFGYLRVRFELGQAVVPTNTVLSPYITDDVIMSITTKTDESRVYTSVEVVPKGLSFTSPSEGNFISIFGRATPPSVAELEGAYIKLELPNSSKKLTDIANWFSKVLTDFQSAVLKAIKIVNKDKQLASLVTLSTIFNNTSPEEVINKLATSGTSTTSDIQRKIFSPELLSGLYQANGSALSQFLGEFSPGPSTPLVYTTNGLFVWNLSTILLSHIDASKEIEEALQASIITNKPDWLFVDSIKGSAIRSWISMLSTLAVLGVNPNNATQLIVNNETIKTILRNSSLYINSRSVTTTSDSPHIPSDPNQKSLPYSTVEIQDIAPENTSSQLYKYGLRINRMSDIYLATLNLTKFRAEFIRRVHENPIRTANLKIIGNPRYKIGSTVLVTSKENVDSRMSYITEGLKKTLHDVFGSADYERLFINTDSVFIEESSEYSNIFGTYEISEDTIKQHFIDAIDFILSASESKSVPITSYVPTLGIYSTGNQKVNEYLDLLIRLAMPDYQEKDIRERIRKRLLVLIGELAEEIFGEDNIFNRNKILSILHPQTYLAAQYYVASVNNSWSLSNFYSTSLSLDYGQAVMLVTAGENVVGYVLIESPAMLYNIKGFENEVIVKDNPLYLSLVNQVALTDSFYKNTSRYSAMESIDRIKYKYKSYKDETEKSIRDALELVK